MTPKRPLSSAVPKHWEYLTAEWGSGSEGPTDIIGAAHAIENETKIKDDFCLDVVAGMLDVVRPLSGFKLFCFSLTIHKYIILPFSFPH